MVSIIQISYFIIMVHPCRMLRLNENWHIHSSVFILLNEGWLAQLRKFIVNDKVGFASFVGRTYWLVCFFLACLVFVSTAGWFFGIYYITIYLNKLPYISNTNHCLLYVILFNNPFQILLNPTIHTIFYLIIIISLA